MMWLLRASRPGNCFKCGEEYERSSIIGVIRLNTSQGIIKHFFHPTCWLDTGLAAFNVVMEGKNNVSPEYREERRLIKHNWAMIKYREKEYRSSLSDVKLINALARVDRIKDNLRMRMGMIGGVPESWDE